MVQGGPSELPVLNKRGFETLIKWLKPDKLKNILASFALDADFVSHKVPFGKHRGLLV